MQDAATYQHMSLSYHTPDISVIKVISDISVVSILVYGPPLA